MVFRCQCRRCDPAAKRSTRGPVKGAADGSDPAILRQSAATESGILSEPGWAQSTKRKISLLQFAEELGNVSRACKIVGYHRDPFYGGRLKGVDKAYVQVVVDVLFSPAFARVCTAKMPVTAAGLLHGRVLTFYEALPTAA